MFEHLDDPNPPPPRQLLVELVVAEGARRRRRRAVLAGGMAATLLVLAGGVRLAQMAGDEADVDLGPANTSPDSPREGGGSGDELSTAPGGTDPVTTTAPPSGETPSGEASTPLGTTTFAALTKDGAVVLADTDHDGAAVRPLVTLPDDTQLGHQVVLSPDRQTVYYVATLANGDEAGGSTIFEVSTSGDAEPEIVDEGESPAVSPDGAYLAYVENSAQIVVRDLHTGNKRRFGGSPVADAIIQDLAFTADSEALVFTAAPPDGPASLYFFDVNFSVAAVASLNDAPKVGPPDDAPEGTNWSTPDARDTDGTIGVIESCCAPVLDSGTAFASVDPATGQPAGEPEPVDGVSGTILQATYDSSGQNQLVLTFDGDTYSLYLRQDGQLRPLDQAGQYVAVGW